MMRRVLASRAGFTYIAVLVMVVVTGIVTARAALVWKTAMQREKEAELISRGTQIINAMRRYYKVREVNGALVPITKPATKVPNLPELKTLLKDPNTSENLRHLRPYCLVDPITGKDMEPVMWEGRIVGARSGSTAEPIKKGNFPFELHPMDFADKSKYRDWIFVYTRVAPTGATGGGISGLPGSSNPGGSGGGPSGGGPSGGGPSNSGGGGGNRPGSTPEYTPPPDDNEGIGHT